MTKLVIIGAGGHGAVAADAALLMGAWSEFVFLDDKEFENAIVIGIPVVGRVEKWLDLIDEAAEFFVAIGENVQRLRLLEEIDGHGGAIASIVHPSAVVSPFATTEKGVLLCAGAVVNSRAAIGMGSIVNTGATVDHDCTLGKSVHLSPGVHIAGNVDIGDCSWLGIGSSVKEGICIGENVVIGAGAVVVSDLVSDQTYVGIPAKPLGR